MIWIGSLDYFENVMLYHTDLPYSVSPNKKLSDSATFSTLTKSGLILLGFYATIVLSVQPI